MTYRPSHKAPRSFDAIVSQVRTDLDPPRVLGYSLPGRGRFDLRADRILAIATPPNPRTRQRHLERLPNHSPNLCGLVALTVDDARRLLPCRQGSRRRRPLALAQKWLDRTKASYATVDLDDASDAAKSAMQAAPNDVEVRTWAGRVALARLDYAETVRLLKGVNTTDARGLRGRAKWYAGEIDQAADELESMLQDPEVHDGWAKAIAGLARRGAGRKPFQHERRIARRCAKCRGFRNSTSLLGARRDRRRASALPWWPRAPPK